jgi:S-adenosylmethionine hydrolase
MPMITLTSDWGWKDHYLAAVKGQIKSRLPVVELIDISHDIRPFNLKEASFIIRNAYKTFPKGTIHLIAVRTEGPGDNPHMAALFDGQYFICGDNGIFSLIFDARPEKLVLIADGKSKRPTFTALDALVEAAVALAEGSELEKLGQISGEWVEKSHFQPVVTGNVIKGLVIYIDNYKNVITNITKELFDSVGKGRKFRLECRGEQINRLSVKYTDVSPGEVLALFSHTGHLEIAINHDHASSLLGLYESDSIMVEFFD